MVKYGTSPQRDSRTGRENVSGHCPRDIVKRRCIRKQSIYQSTLLTTLKHERLVLKVIILAQVLLYTILLLAPSRRIWSAWERKRCTWRRDPARHMVSPPCERAALAAAPPPAAGIQSVALRGPHVWMTSTRPVGLPGRCAGSVPWLRRLSMYRCCPASVPHVPRGAGPTLWPLLKHCGNLRHESGQRSRNGSDVRGDETSAIRHGTRGRDECRGRDSRSPT